MQVSKRLIVLGIFGLLALPLMGVASAQNLLVNGDFETGDLTGWQVFGQSPNSDVIIVSGEQTDASSQPGLYSAFLDNHAEAIGLTLKGSTPENSVVPGQFYYAFDLKLGELANSGVFGVQIFAEQTGGPVLQTFLPVIEEIQTDWNLYQGTYIAPAGTDYLTIQFIASTGAVSGAIATMYVDNVFLGQTGGPVATEEMNMGSIKALFR